MDGPVSPQLIEPGVGDAEGIWLADTELTFRWHSSEYSANYHLVVFRVDLTNPDSQEFVEEFFQIGMLPAFTRLENYQDFVFYNHILPDTSIALSLIPNGGFYIWSVAGINSSEIEGWFYAIPYPYFFGIDTSLVGAHPVH